MLIFSTQKITLSLSNPSSPHKKQFVQFQTQKSNTSIPVEFFECPPWTTLPSQKYGNPRKIPYNAVGKSYQ